MCDLSSLCLFSHDEQSHPISIIQVQPEIMLMMMMMIKRTSTYTIITGRKENQVHGKKTSKVKLLMNYALITAGRSFPSIYSPTHSYFPPDELPITLYLIYYHFLSFSSSSQSAAIKETESKKVMSSVQCLTKQIKYQSRSVENKMHRH